MILSAPESQQAAPTAPSWGAAVGQRLVDQLRAVVLDADVPIRLTVAALLAGGHVLLEDRPGVGKTLLAKALAASIGGSVGRVQGTADVLPADLTGFSVFNPATGAWTFRPGPLFNDVLIVDELNRATPRAQSALLEAMAEGQVTIDGERRDLPSAFFVIATQNPGKEPGTFPLAAAQRDRFAVSVSLGLPRRDAERQLIHNDDAASLIATIGPVVTVEQVHTAQRMLSREVHVAEPLTDYLLDVVGATRSMGGGASPRATQLLARVTRAWAALDNRGFATPSDVQAVADAVLAHRIEGDGLPSQRRQIRAIVESVPVPAP